MRALGTAHRTERGLSLDCIGPPGVAFEEVNRLLNRARFGVVCGRDDPAEAAIPSFDQIQSQMADERVNLRARRYLRDLRRDAVIDYR